MSHDGLPEVSVYPGRCSGRPVLGGHRLPTETVARYYRTLGQSETEMAYGIERNDILICCWFEARYGGRKIRAAWKVWLEEREGALWAGEWDGVPLPPDDSQPAVAVKR